MEEHEQYMRRCFQLATMGSGKVAPNPLVGSVLVYQDKIIAEGYHRSFGGPHAEVEVLRQVNDMEVLRNSTLYVNLEPCSHTGKTPPCTDLIIEKKVGRVVISIRDPFYKVNGNGVKLLSKAGIPVTENILAGEGAWLNRRFITYHKLKRPYVILKWAESSDGLIAPITSNPVNGIQWISNKVSRLLVHMHRSRERAILAGNKTIALDNPLLNVRGISGVAPVKVIIDPRLKLHREYHVFAMPGKTYIANYIKSGEESNLVFIKLQSSGDLVHELLEFLYKEQIQSVLVEGGAFTINEFINTGNWDEALVFRGKKMLNEGITAPVTGTRVISKFILGSDVLSVFLNNFVA